MPKIDVTVWRVTSPGMTGLEIERFPLDSDIDALYNAACERAGEGVRVTVQVPGTKGFARDNAVLMV